MVTWLAGNRIRGTTAERPALGVSGVGGWVELARTTLGVAGDTIDVTGLPNKRYYMVLSNAISSGYTYHQIRLNGDSGSNYAVRRANNGATDQTITSQAGIFIAPTTMASKLFSVSYLANVSGKEKLGIDTVVNQDTAGAGTPPKRVEMVGKWANTSNSISSVTMYNTHSGNYDSGSEVVVLGWDPADTHTTNFWEELASVSGDGTSKTLSSGTFTAKKYLWIQAYGSVATQMDNMGLQFNSDTGSNYARRISLNGASDATSISQTYIRLAGGSATNGSLFGSGFIINNSANEKLLTSHWARNRTSGAGTSPERFESTGKWANTSSQITSVQLRHDGSSDWDSDSIIKVWGSD
jgi:hypothetical protein